MPKQLCGLMNQDRDSFYLKFKRLENFPSAYIQPFFRGSEDSAAYDLTATQDTLLLPQQVTVFPLGLATEFPPGWVGLIRDRSSLGLKGITVFGGVIDSDYRGEWKVSLYNSTTDLINIKFADRIAQVIFLPVGLCEPTAVDQLNETVRGLGGFGSTGR